MDERATGASRHEAQLHSIARRFDETLALRAGHGAPASDVLARAPPPAARCVEWARL